MWEKWLFLSGLGVATTLMRASVGEITSAPGGLAFAARVVDEATAIVTAAGFPPAEAAVARLRNTLLAREASLHLCRQPEPLEGWTPAAGRM